MFEWPENAIPLPSQDISVDPRYNTARTRMDSGRARVRPRNTKPLTQMPVRWDLTRNEYAIFVAIWDHALTNGTDWFYIRLPQPNDDSLTLQKVRFSDDYSAQHRHFENWTITTTLEIFEESKLSPEALDIYLIYDGNLDVFNQDLSALCEEVSHFNQNHNFIS